MKTNREGIDLIKYYEGLHDGDLSTIGLEPKMDPIGIWTEGYGRAMRYNNKWLSGIKNQALALQLRTIFSEEDAEKALKEDLKKFEGIVNSQIKISLNENEFSALVSYAYNTGGSRTLFKLINECASAKVIRNWFENHYISARGVKLNGLVKRRKAEADLFFKPI